MQSLVSAETIRNCGTEGCSVSYTLPAYWVHAGGLTGVYPAFKQDQRDSPAIFACCERLGQDNLNPAALCSGLVGLMECVVL